MYFLFSYHGHYGNRTETCEEFTWPDGVDYHGDCWDSSGIQYRDYHLDDYCDGMSALACEYTSVRTYYVWDCFCFY